MVPMSMVISLLVMVILPKMVNPVFLTFCITEHSFLSLKNTEMLS